MRALFVAPYLPTPGSGGRTRLVNFMERLARLHDVQIVAFTARDQDPADNPYPGVAVPPPPVRARPSGARGVARFYREKLLDPLPSFASWMSSSAMIEAVRTACETFRPDVVQVETTEMGQYLPFIPSSVARALDMQDVASRWFGRVRRFGSAQERALMGVELLKTRRYEKTCARIPDVVYVSSPVERAFYAKLTGVDPLEVPNGVDTHAFAPMQVDEGRKTLLFVGPLTYDANLDGLKWFIHDVLPYIRSREPDVRLDVVGTPVDLEVPSEVRLLGRVEDVRPHVARAAVSIVPVRVGTGTRYKILEALSMQRAVVSTTVGAEGLGVINGEHVMIADDPQDFARAVIRLLDEPELRAHLGVAGRAHVVPRFDWKPLVARVDESWARAVEATRRAH
ncbi:MAG: glycosyltransferase family 4 protein [Actinomycetota bacterium]|nr:glycosyltransferase family 4 protein [Actinomycetota bacterium]